MENGKIILDGMSADDFFTRVREESYLGYKRALAEQNKLELGIDWKKFGQSMSIADIMTVFPKERDTIRRWIKKNVFGDYQGMGKELSVTTNSVRKVYEENLIKTKR